MDVLDSVLDMLPTGKMSKVKRAIGRLADINVCDEQGSSLLLWLVSSSHMEAFRALLSYPGLDVDKENDYGDTPLSAAVEKGNLSMVESLIKHGALVTPKLIEVSRELATKQPSSAAKKIIIAEGSRMPYTVDYEGVLHYLVSTRLEQDF